ncbi:hypothetical protein ACFOU2_24700 [Bacillus songklensis]|uniref:Flagellar hook-length control protein FliK n=1 Tax=Bacillus songklensis TaxID=1069116 RepID=A0ABV8B853_9BACI
MQIQNQLWTTGKEPIAESGGFKQGDVVKGTITEKLSDTEAMVQVNGKDVKMKFDQPIGTEKEVMVQVQKMNGEAVEVKNVTAVPAKAPLFVNIDAVLAEIGLYEGKQEAKQYIQRQLERGRVRQEHIKPIVSFWKETKGTNDEKQRTVEAALQKKLPVKAAVLSAVHEALNGKLAPTFMESIKSTPEQMVQVTEEEIGPLVKSIMEEMDTQKAWTHVESPFSSEGVEEGQVLPELPAQSYDGMKSVTEQNVHISTDSQPISKDVMVTTVTKKLKQITQEFQTYKKETHQSLQLVEKSLQVNKEQAAPLLEMVIHKLDKAILKSDFLLYADMKTEKSMLQASNLLKEAKQLLSKGETQDSLKVIHQVKELIQKIEYKPSEVKMVHYVKDELLSARTEPSFQQAVKKAAQLAVPQEMTGRKVFELVRQLGLNRENELMDSLVFKNKEVPNANDLKSMILAVQQKQGAEKLPSALGSMLQKITGQQLLNKHEGTNQVQNAFFHLPVQVSEEVRDVKVFIKAQNKFDKMDWENCSLYFLLQTKTLGDVGISLMAVNRRLGITFKNDEEAFAEKAKPLTEKLSKAIQEIGFEITSVHYQKFGDTTEETEKQTVSKHSHVKPRQEGFDYSI